MCKLLLRSETTNSKMLCHLKESQHQQAALRVVFYLWFFSRCTSELCLCNMVEDIHTEILVVRETRIHAEIEGNFVCGFFRVPQRFPAEFIGIFDGFIGD